MKIACKILAQQCPEVYGRYRTLFVIKRAKNKNMTIQLHTKSAVLRRPVAQFRPAGYLDIALFCKQGGQAMHDP
jgi:hypothetical protein